MTATSVLSCGGIVLCGGRSSRMGFPKAMLPFGPERLLQRMVRLLRQVVAPVVVVAAESQELPALPDEVRVLRDRRRYQGPLEGIAVGLAALAGEVAAAYVTGCDTPLLRTAFVQRLVELMGPMHPAYRKDPPADAAWAGSGDCPARLWEVVVPQIDGFFHPLAAVYRTSLAPHVERLLAGNRLRPVYLFDEVPTRIVRAEELQDVDPELDSLRNVNQRDDYRAALRACGYEVPLELGPSWSDRVDPANEGPPAARSDG
jgi:molybdopterin-guanine dinucleotide biosynthesis protein A